VSHTKAKRPAKAVQADQLHERIEEERRKLQRASALLTALVHSADSGLESEQASDVASVALDLVEAALAGLDIVALKRPGGAT
jgi:hypothetical protein